ncbi:hypothetical protein FB451DRAFT_284168 [Mycena latifolia]|nr:hypothetical protein FB451DRAFT_305733 [Mycena latifolia]KAJ7474075.1 hypothetical protein FB451DRAFT_284168 [Mycena latifolia]
MDELAQELVDHFIDCWNVADKDAMSSCGLVCKRWLPRSRYHLFSQVSLNAKNLDSFVDLVESSRLPVLSYIRHLILVFLGSPLDTTHLARLHPCQNLTSIKLFLPFQLIETSDALRWLSSEEDLRTHLRSWHDRSVCFSSLAFGTIRLLEMPFHTITDLISCVPGITTLKISGISISTGSLGTTNCAHPTRLDHLGLSLYRGGFPRVFSWLLSLPAIPILRSLTLHEMLGPDDQVDEDWTPITAYLQQVGDGLLSLQLAFLTTQGCLNFQRYMLPYTPNLRNLTLIVNLPSDVLDTILLLRTSHSWNSIFVHINPVAAGDELWSALDAALAEPHFRTLKRFSIDFFTWHLPQPDAPSIIPQPRLLMPLANARGILD